MRARAKCPKCGVELESNSEDCIKGEFAVHDCGDMENEGGEITDGVEWKLVSENEKELLEMEE
jgi:hypothetical protein